MDIKLTKGFSYTYKGTRYAKDTVVTVDSATGAHLLATGKFTPVKGNAADPAPPAKTSAAAKPADDKAAGKLKIKRKEDPPEVKTPATTGEAGVQSESTEYLAFKSKAEVLAYAKEKYGVELESTKLDDLKAELTAHLKDVAEQKAAELALSKEGAVAV